jgi:hypothetical protein
MRIAGRVSLNLLVIVLVSAATFTVLRKFFGLRVEAWGAGHKPHFYFFSPEEHYSALEKNRAQQKSASPGTTAPQAGAPPYWTNFPEPNRDGVYD